MLEPSRYNSRDSTWWFIKAVSDYLDITNDFSILKVKIKLKYLSDIKQKHFALKEK